MLVDQASQRAETTADMTVSCASVWSSATPINTGSINNSIAASMYSLCWTGRPDNTSQYRVAQKIWHHFYLYALTSPNINRFSKLVRCQNPEKICNNTLAKNPTTPEVCRYTTLWNISVIKATTENKTTSVTTHFKKLTTGNNVFIVSLSKVSCNCHILDDPAGITLGWPKTWHNFFARLNFIKD